MISALLKPLIETILTSGCCVSLLLNQWSYNTDGTCFSINECAVIVFTCLSQIKHRIPDVALFHLSCGPNLSWQLIIQSLRMAK